MGASEGEGAGADPAGEGQAGAAAKTAGEAGGESSSSSWAWDAAVSNTVTQFRGVWGEVMESVGGFGCDGIL